MIISLLQIAAFVVLMAAFSVTLYLLHEERQKNEKLGFEIEDLKTEKAASQAYFRGLLAESSNDLREAHKFADELQSFHFETEKELRLDIQRANAVVEMLLQSEIGTISINRKQARQLFVV